MPAEAPAFEHDDVGHAVMMATPVDLEDYAVGFTLTERLAAKAEDIADVEVAELPCGWAARITLREDASEGLRERVRRSLTEGSCGLSGLETIEQVLRPLPRLAPGARVTRVAVARARRSAAARQRQRCRTRRGLLRSGRGATAGARGCRPAQCDGQADRRRRARGTQSRLGLPTADGAL
ncbi:MAG: formate dehydrogenase accessory sulfurtransferase FdhD [Sphingomonadaceae bacterium]|nr:formate dehydrogenase accessory sulfurtransferase FdhD [Sphingomonadaceae bacterium]